MGKIFTVMYNNLEGPEPKPRSESGIEIRHGLSFETFNEILKNIKKDWSVTLSLLK